MPSIVRKKCANRKKGVTRMSCNPQKIWWAVEDSNLRPPRCQRLYYLIYRVITMTGLRGISQLLSQVRKSAQVIIRNLRRRYILYCALLCCNVLVMNTTELRKRLYYLCQNTGSIREWSDKNHVSFSYVSAVIRGDAAPGNKILKAMGVRKAFSLKKTTVMRFEDI